MAIYITWEDHPIISIILICDVQYIYWKQMAKAATLIQNKYRLYCEHKRFKKSQQAATCIQNYYRNYKEHQNQTRKEKESTPSAGLKFVSSCRTISEIISFFFQTHLLSASTTSSSQKDPAVHEADSFKVSGPQLACYFSAVKLNTKILFAPS